MTTHRQQKEGKKEEPVKTRKSIFESVFDEAYIPFGALFDKNYLGENVTVAPSPRKSKHEPQENDHA